MPPLSDDGRPPLHPGSPSPMHRPDFSLVALYKHPLNIAARRRVSFFPRVQVHEVPNTLDQEANQVWYSANEIDQFEKAAEDVSRRMLRRTLRRDDCTRGLEQRSTSGYRDTNFDRVNAIFSVLSEQHSLGHLSLQNDEQIAHVYRGVSVRCKLSALDRANHDAAEARKFQLEDPYASDSMEDYGISDCWLLGSVRRLLPSRHGGALSNPK